jgi:hypothetical protein
MKNQFCFFWATIDKGFSRHFACKKVAYKNRSEVGWAAKATGTSQATGKTPQLWQIEPGVGLL